MTFDSETREEALEAAEHVRSLGTCVCGHGTRRASPTALIHAALEMPTKKTFAAPARLRPFADVH
jgi:hypothetical protein